MTNDWFAAINNRGLGDVAQDIIQYGGKIYATVTFSNSLEVIDRTTGASTRIDMGDRNPRNLVADGGKLYITCYNPCSVVRVDTATLAFEATCQLGESRPEGIAVSGNHLFIASSYKQTGDYAYDYDSTLYVVGINSFEVATTVKVGLNPNGVVKVNDNTIAVSYNGNYGDVPEGITLVNANNFATTEAAAALTSMAAYNGTLYGYHSVTDWSSYPDVSTVTTYYSINPTTGAATELPMLTTGNGSPYSFSINPDNGDFYVGTDGNFTANGDIYCFSADGTAKWNHEAGMYPSKVIFIR